MKFLIINGPNLNMLGIREPSLYGSQNYEYLVDKVRKYCQGMGIQTEFYQSNHEGDLVDRIQSAYFDGTSGIIINPGAYTHTSVALLDAVKAVGIPTAEVHISDVGQREDFRQISYIRAACVCTVTGRGLDGYCIAADMLYEHIKSKGEKGL